MEWAMRLQSIAQAGLTFSTNQYDLDRYQQLRELSIEILQQYTDISYAKIKDLFASETGYQTPKVDVRAAIFRDDKILLVNEKIDGAWSMPGGWADINTSVRESVIKECREEAGALVLPKRIIAIHVNNRHNNRLSPYFIYKIFVECELQENCFRENTETLEARFFDRENLPVLSLERTVPEQINLCFEARNHKLFEPLFD